jgi:hypothetical protein
MSTDNNNNISTGTTTRRRAVLFSERIDMIGKGAANPEDFHQAWYLKNELAEFKLQARDFILGIGNRWEDQETRGFERYNAHRASQKAMTRKVTLLACSQKGLTHDDIAFIVSRSSSWAVKQAFLTACQDYCEAYCPEMVSVLQSKGDNLAVISCKRELELKNAAAEGRRVRLRSSY